MKDRDVRSALVTTARELCDRGYNTLTGGNLSIRVDGVVYITPSGVPSRRLKLAEITRVTLAGGFVDGRPASKEQPSHLAVYRARSDVSAIIHAHPVSALACAHRFEKDPFPPLTVDFVVKVGAVKVVDFEMPGSDDMAEVVGSRLTGSQAVLLKNHGLFVGADDIEKAMEMVEQIEANAHLNLLLDGKYGGLSANQVRAIQRRYRRH